MALVEAKGGTQARRPIDPNVPRFGQGMTAFFLLVAFVLDLWWVVPVLAAILGAGAIGGPGANLWSQLYRWAVRPVFRIAVPEKKKDPAPPRFANLLGFVFLTLGSAALVWGGAAVRMWLGWGLALVVAALALLAAMTNICVGCEIYVRLVKWRARSVARA